MLLKCGNLMVTEMGSAEASLYSMAICQSTLHILCLQIVSDIHACIHREIQSACMARRLTPFHLAKIGKMHGDCVAIVYMYMYTWCSYCIHVHVYMV